MSEARKRVQHLTTVQNKSASWMRAQVRRMLDDPDVNWGQAVLVAPPIVVRPTGTLEAIGILECGKNALINYDD